MMNKHIRTFILLWLVITPVFGVGPGEWFFLQPQASDLWQKAIGFFAQPNGDTSLIIYDVPNDSSIIRFRSHDPSDITICPMSAFGYYDYTMKEALRSYPLLSIENDYADIVYNVNTGSHGWVKINSKYSLTLFTDSLSVSGMDVIYLGTVGAQHYHSIGYFSKPNGRLIKYKTIMPFLPPQPNEKPDDTHQKIKSNVCISIKGYNYHGWHFSLCLGTAIKINGDWLYVGDYDYNDMDIKPRGWIRFRDKNGNLIVWFVGADRW